MQHMSEDGELWVRTTSVLVTSPTSPWWLSGYKEHLGDMKYTTMITGSNISQVELLTSV